MGADHRRSGDVLEHGLHLFDLSSSGVLLRGFHVKLHKAVRSFECPLFLMRFEDWRSPNQGIEFGQG